MRDNASRNSMSGATEALGIPELIQLAVAVLPPDAVRGALARAADAAREKVRKEVGHINVINPLSVCVN